MTIGIIQEAVIDHSNDHKIFEGFDSILLLESLLLSLN